MSGGINPTLQTGLLAALEAALNRALELAPASAARLAALEGRVLALHCTAPPVDVYVEPGAGGLRLMGVYEESPSTSVRGSAADFMELASADDPAATLINGGLEIGGDSAPLLELQRIVSELDMDWEAPLVDALGDVAGHQLAQLLRAAFAFGKQAGNGLMRQLSEYILEEGRLSPPKLEQEDFFREVRELELRVERLQSRASRLAKRIAGLRD